MIRLGLHLTLRSGREALVRLVVTAVAVGIGVGLLLSVLSMYHAYETTVAKPCWQCTEQSDANGPLLWNYSEDEYAGQTIDRLDVAVIDSDTPLLPGLSRMPAAGQFYASPAMAALLSRTPADQLGDRFPGKLAGVIGPAALQSPDDLVIVIGRSESDLVSAPRTLRISHIQTAPRGLSTSQFYEFGFALGSVALLVPMVVLIGGATRMAAGRREERYAAMRLVGATRWQIRVVASVEASVGAVLGALCGIGIYALLRPSLPHLRLLGFRFYTDAITPTAWGYAAVLVAVPMTATVASLVSLHRVQISPLGVSRRVTPPAPRIGRIIPLMAGIVLFCVPVLVDPSGQRSAPGLSVLALVVVMLGMMVAGPWLTMVSARALARWSRGGSGLLAARRLADNPRTAFRSVSGLVLAVMVGTALAALAPAAIASENTAQDGSIGNVLRVGFVSGDRAVQGPDNLHVALSPTEASPLLAAVAAIPGTQLIPVYHPSPADDSLPQVGLDRGGESVIGCTDLAKIPVLGTCPRGATAVLVDTGSLYTDNLASLNKSLPLVTATSPATNDDLGSLRLSDLMVMADNAGSLERARTVLSSYSSLIDPDESPKTFGEVAAARAELYSEIQRLVTVIAGITLITAGCGIAVAVTGGLVERKRPFTLLRVSGTATGTLYRAVLLETVFPLVAATAVAFGVGLGLAIPIARALAPHSHTAAVPQASFYLTLAGGLAVSIAAIVACLPLLGRITATEHARFE